MKKYPLDRAIAIVAVVALPLLYLIVALIYSAASAPFGRQVDPESAYAMNGLAWSVGYSMLKSDHPGTTTTMLAGLVIRSWAFLATRSDVVEFGLKNFDAIIYAARAVQAVILAGALVASGVIIRNTTGSLIAAMLFQVAPFTSAEVLHFEVILTPESLMVSCAILGMALVLKAALQDKSPSVGLGIGQGVIFALGLSSKFLYAPLALLGLSLFRNQKAYWAAGAAGILTFFVYNRIFHPLVFTSGFHWMASLATHKGVYGEGEAGFIDFATFWPNMGQIILAEPVIFAVFTIGGIVAIVQMVRTGRYLDPVSLTLIATCMAFAAQVVATSKHFALHYMLATWVLTGGALVLTSTEIRRLFPRIPPKAIAGAAAAVCVVLISRTLLETRAQGLSWMASNAMGARLSRAVVAAGPACANVSSMFVRAPEHDLNFGADLTLSLPEMVDRFSAAYKRTFDVPLLDHSSYYRGTLMKDFEPYSYRQLAAEYACIVVRTPNELDEKSSLGLLELNPEHCLVQGIHVYTVGIACTRIGQAYQKLSQRRPFAVSYALGYS